MRWLLVVAMLLGCGDSRNTLRIDLRTDLRPFFEMTRVTSALSREGEMLFSRDHTVQASDYAAGVRIAEFEDLPGGDYDLDVVVRGTETQSQRLSVRVRGDTAATVVITRDCRGVRCDDPSAPACINGACVPETCVGEALAECGAPMCTLESCGTLAACARASCDSGACLSIPDDSMCAADELCDPVDGCVPESMEGVPVLADELVVSRWASCARRGTEVTCWGNNVNGEIGAELAGAYGPTRVSVEADQLAASTETMCARRGGEVRCWGGNNEGELGQDDTTPRRGEVVDVNLFEPAIELFALGSGFCVIDANDEYSCWGSNAHRQLIGWMDEDVVGPSVPEQPGTIDIAGGPDHLCVLKMDGMVFCTGRGISGEIGDGGMVGRDMLTGARVPEIVVDIVSIRPPRDAAASTTCARVLTEQVYCWGFDDAGQVGSGGTVGELAPSPFQVTGLIGVDALYDSMRPVFARMDDGIIAWGARANGLFGDASTAGVEESPIPTDLGRFDGPAFGITHACGIEADEVWCWGTNDDGTLPGIDVGDVTEPYRVTY